MSDPATPAPVDAQAALNALSPEARASWELTGEWPKAADAPPPTPDVPADDPEPDDAPEPEPEPATLPAPEPTAATPEKPVSKRQQQINDLIRTRTEAEQRAAQLEQRLAALERSPHETPDPVEAPKPAASQPTFPPFDQWMTLDGNADKDFHDYMDARADHRDALKQASSEREALKNYRDKQLQTWYERRDAFAATEPEFRSKWAVVFDSPNAQPGTVIYNALLESPVGPQVAWHFVNHPDAFDRIARLSPIQQVLELGKLGALYDTSDSPRASASAGPAAKHVTTAPAPPTTLSARSADPTDPSAAAVVRGDFRAFEAEENRRAIAASR